MTFWEEYQIRKLIAMMEEDEKKEKERQQKVNKILTVAFVAVYVVGILVALKTLFDLEVIG